MARQPSKLRGPALLLIGVVLGAVSNLWTSQSEVQTFFSQYRLATSIVAILLVVAGCVLSVGDNVSTPNKPSRTSKRQPDNGESYSAQDRSVIGTDNVYIYNHPWMIVLLFVIALGAIIAVVYILTTSRVPISSTINLAATNAIANAMTPVSTNATPTQIQIRHHRFVVGKYENASSVVNYYIIDAYNPSAPVSKWPYKCFGSISPDGKKVVYSIGESKHSSIYVANLDCSESTRLTDAPGGNGGPTWSPDGQKIAFTSTRESTDLDIYVMNPDGSDQRRLTNSPGLDGGIAWSPDSKKIAFTTERAAFPGTDTTNIPHKTELYVMDADGSNQTPLTNNDSFEHGASWSPDGKKIVFFSDRDRGDPEVYIMDANGANQTRLTTMMGEDIYPEWSPEGNKIAFVSTRGFGEERLCVMNPDGTQQVCATGIQGSIYYPAQWIPDDLVIQP